MKFPPVLLAANYKLYISGAGKKTAKETAGAMAVKPELARESSSAASVLIKVSAPVIRGISATAVTDEQNQL